MKQGLILKGIGGFYYVSTEDGIFECKAKGLFRKEKITPLPGDKVVISEIKEGKEKGFIEQVLPRINVLERPAVANIDRVVVVVAACNPQPDLLLLDKLLITIENKGIKPVIFINKIDLDTKKDYRCIENDYLHAGYNVLTGSTSENGVSDELLKILQTGTTVFAGQSGVGKSTLINGVFKNQIMETGDVSSKIGRGKHTTRHAELLKLYGQGYVADTPGFSSFETENLKESELQDFYKEFEPYLGECRFSTCGHVSEPDCKIKKALVDKQISEGRYLRYVQLFNYLKAENANKYSKRVKGETYD